MGEVFSARDTRLERDVALKILPAGSLLDDAARKRFRKEALALSRLNHPNIATIFDFDTDNGIDFIAMELVVGETLTQKVASGPLPEKMVLSLGSQIADALEEARKVAADLQANMPKHYVCPYEIGTIHLWLGEKDEAFQWFEKGYDARSRCISIMKYDPRLDPIRSDPRYQNLLQRVGFPQ